MTAAPPAKPATTMLVGWIGKLFWLRVEGKGTFQCSIQLKRAFETVLDRGTKTLVVDLDRCPIMDSTFLGTLTYAASRVRKAGGGSLSVLNANARNLQLLSDLGLDHLMEVDRAGVMWKEEREAARACLAACSESTEATREEQTRHLLQAHKTLSNICESNEGRFRDVIHFLEQELQAPPGGQA
ncbi:MAG TPA: STAS domain-containing protein [Prosthecobacter sp.]|nr:STAS domain-containing protein [Prosthecobacter sp.]HRK14121.1 STAS domain-containing protein [Prosthecobacter sp.]